MSFKAALIQMKVEGGAAAVNLSRAEAIIATAASDGAKLVLLPEAMDLGWTHPTSRELAQPIPQGSSCARLAQAAAKHGVYLCAGLTERDGNRVYNAAVLIDPAGNLLLKHRKLNELVIGHACYDQGDRLGVVHTPLGTIGVMICADGFAPGQMLTRSLAYMGADIILSPCAWAVPADHDNAREPYGDLWRNSYKPVAREFSLWILAASNVGPLDAGPWAGRRCIGCSRVIDDEGREVAQGPYGVDAETILYVDVMPRERPARGCGWVEQA